MPETDREVGQIYRERSQRFAAMRDRCAARSRLLTHVRLIAFIAAGLSVLRLLEPDAWNGPFWPLLTAVLVVLFLALVVYHSELRLRCRWYADLSKLNDEALARLARDWAALPESDGVVADPEHPFADDLDLFGDASIFSLLGTIGTPPGRSTLRDWLLAPAEPRTILERQAAVVELAPLIDEREEITARGRLLPEATPELVEQFLAWAEGEPWLAPRRWLVWTARLLPLVSAALILLNIAGIVSYTTWVIALAVNLAFSSIAGKGVRDTLDRVFARENAFQQYAALFRLLSNASFSAPALRRLQSRLTGDRASAHVQMARLHRLEALAEVRHSMMNLPIQALTLWDFYVLLRLEKWQLTAGRHTRTWLSALGESDALAALAALHFDNPRWAFPQIVDDGSPTVDAKQLGHPLLPDEVRVANDVKLGPPGTFLLVTGSNMSGKSTLLRAIGTNVVLAGAGAPVCASSMRTPPVRLETSMRVHDSLQRGLSHFMAELERLKGVVEAARRAGTDGGSTLLYLLDDIFQGTNTAERQIAARRVITYLLATPAIGAVTSHDLRLADTEELSTACEPVHFTEKIEESTDGPTISFDYKLRPGIATSSNALKLLEVVGLDSQETSQ
jgi:ABC-type multidrug transport system fused ATPase/permease subunit